MAKNDSYAPQLDNILVFNALDYASELKSLGVPEKQAEFQARAMDQMKDSIVATKQDLGIPKGELKRDIADVNLRIETVREELKRDIADVHLRIETVREELKKDIETLRAELKRDIETLRAELKKDIEHLGEKMSLQMRIHYFLTVASTLAGMFALAKMGLLSVQ